MFYLSSISVRGVCYLEVVLVCCQIMHILVFTTNASFLLCGVVYVVDWLMQTQFTSSLIFCVSVVSMSVGEITKLLASTESSISSSVGAVSMVCVLLSLGSLLVKSAVVLVV